jgi:hypothetical protein
MLSIVKEYIREERSIKVYLTSVLIRVRVFNFY